MPALAGAQALEQPLYLGPPAEEHASITLLKGPQPGKRWAPWIPREQPLGIKFRSPQPIAKTLKSLPVGSRAVDRLRICEQRMPPPRRDRHRHDRLSQRTRHRQLRKTPLRCHRRRTANKQHAIRPPQLPIQLSLPLRARRNPLLGIEIQKHRRHAVPDQPLAQPHPQRVIPAV